jgi:Protein of unknown function (DUF3810)
MDRIRISNDATYFPVALTDVMLAAPLVSRVILGATLPGKVLQLAALGVYAASALQDWADRRGMRRIDFLQEFGADVHHLEPMPPAEREAEVHVLARRLNREYVAITIPREELPAVVDQHLTGYVARITGQEVETSTEIRTFGLVQVLFPFALGACDFLSGDVAIFRDTGVFEPHVIAHEFCHRKGYYKELEAQALAYLALAGSGDPVLVQSALCERLHRQLRVLSEDDEERFDAIAAESGLREELREQLLRLRPQPSRIARPIANAMRTLYDERMKLTGQNGLSDYDRGFTDFLHLFETGTGARQVIPDAARAAGVAPAI